MRAEGTTGITRRSTGGANSLVVDERPQTSIELALQHHRGPLIVLVMLLPIACWAWIVVLARDMYGSILAAQHVTRQLSDLATDIIFSASASKRKVVTDCVMKKLAAFLTGLSECRPAPDDTQGRPPDCPPNYHEYAGRCVPDDPQSSG